MLRGMRNAVEVRKKRAGMGVNDERTMHMLFLGNPGTGKTTIARLVARMLAALGILKKGQLIEVTRKVYARSHMAMLPRISKRAPAHDLLAPAGARSKRCHEEPTLFSSPDKA